MLIYHIHLNELRVDPKELNDINCRYQDLDLLMTEINQYCLKYHSMIYIAFVETDK